MEVDFLDKFSKDIDRVSIKSVKNNITKLIIAIESAKTINEISKM